MKDPKETWQEVYRPTKTSLGAVMVAVAATYTYFLVFAQFGFLQAVQRVAGADDAMLRPIMGVMGLGGILGSAGSAWLFDRKRARALILTGYGLAGGAAAISWGAGSVAAFFLAAALTGLGTGLTTVTLAAMLRREIGDGALGRCIGAGTGLAYALANLPPVFAAGPQVQAVIGLVAAGAGGLAVGRFAQRGPGYQTDGFDYHPRGIFLWVLIFFALVWLDSAVFYVIQHTADLKAALWAGEERLYLNAAIHALAAFAAGWALDRRWLGSTTLGAAALLLAACGILNTGAAPRGLAGGLYVAGVSAYSTALVFYPARSGRVGLAAVVYAVAGWLGSALGVGLAKNLHAVPDWFLLTAGVVMAGAFALRGRLARRPGLMLVVAGLVLTGWPAGLPAADLITTGRRVYVAEGCIHCHSQYVRPGTMDEELWGPARPLADALALSPPLLGNRRQGPDLQNVGLRRPREWNRVHLIAPRSVVAGSRMPAYGHLFTGDASRGEALLDYLASLGRPAGAVQ